MAHYLNTYCCPVCGVTATELARKCYKCGQMLKCPKCGERIKDKIDNCSACGAQLEKGSYVAELKAGDVILTTAPYVDGYCVEKNN